MPIGCISCVPYVASRLMQQRPESVLDLGIGMGFYGAVIRQWLDIGVRPWHTRLVGVEGWSGYRNPAWDLYDEVHVESIESYLDKTRERFEAVLLMDVLEHFERASGLHIIGRIQELLHPGGQFHVATPAVWMEQGSVHGNEFERHQSIWTAGELEGLGFVTIMDGTADLFGNEMVLACFER